MNNITIHIEKDYEALSKKAAEVFARAVASDPAGSFGFATGSTPEGMYEEMIKKQNDGTADFSKLTAFNLDEYFPISPSHDQSYAYFMAHKLFDSIGLPPENRNIPKGNAELPGVEALAYEDKVIAGKIKMQILGIGHNGHIGFNEPADSFSSKTNYVSLAEATVKANSRFFDDIAAVPRNAITMGVKTIMMAECVLLLVSGEAKAPILWDAIKGPITPLVPASVLQLHKNLTVVADTDAAKHFDE